MASPVRIKAVSPTGEVWEFESMADARDRGGFAHRGIYNCLQGYQSTYLGWTFEALDERQLRGGRAHLQSFADMRNQGMTNREVAEAKGITLQHTTLLLSRAAKLGMCEAVPKPSKGRRLTSQQAKEMVKERRETGASVYSLSKRHGVAYTTLRRTLALAEGGAL